MRHQSCVVLTSREAPLELATLGGTARSLELDGLGVPDGQVLLADKQLSGTTQHWAELVGRFGGNGLALKVVGEGIRQVFGGHINAYLEGSGADTAFGGIRRLLAEQIGRSSPLEQDVLRVLAVEREPVTVLQLLAELAPHGARGVVLQAIEALRRRSLVERAETAGAAAFTLQSVVLEYVTDRLVETVADEVQRDHPVLLVTQPLIKAQAKDYVRQTQERMIGEPILRLLGAQDRERGTEQRLLGLLHGWRGRSPAEQGFGPGNVVNLLRLLRGDLCELDLSRLAIRQSYLADVDARDASLLNADLAETVLAGAFDLPGSVALSGDGALLAAGTLTGQVWLWRVADRTPLLVVQGHTGGVWGVALSSDGRLLASGGGDGLVRLWETSTGQPLAILHGHAGAGWRIALSGDGRLVASGGDGTVRLWETSTGQPVATLAGHIGTVWGVALSADGKLVASGGEDGTVRLWETGTWRALATLQGHAGGVRRMALSADGHMLVSAGFDGTVRLWAAPGGTHLRTLRMERRFERLDITGLTGITEAQRATLLSLGAVEQD